MMDFLQAMSWVYAQRQTLISTGEDAPLDGKHVCHVRVCGTPENIPLIAVEHCRLHAVQNTGDVVKDKTQTFDLLDKMDEAAGKLLAMGWSHIQITANALNMTVPKARELVQTGLYSEMYGIPLLFRGAKP